MQATIEQFRENIARIRDLNALQATIEGLTTGAVDLGDILRAEVVMLVSALDYFVHEVVRIKLLAVYTSGVEFTPAGSAFRVSLASVRDFASDRTENTWLEQEIRVSHSWQSFQKPDKIAEAFRLISTVKLWDTVAVELATDAASVKAQLATIVDRRNKIAHEADLDPTNPRSRWPIDRAMVEDAIQFVERLGEAMYTVATT